jgi:aspartate/glutamate racemase
LPCPIVRRDGRLREGADEDDFHDIEELQHAGDWDQAADRLVDAARRVEAAGAELLVLCTNTMHRLADQVQAAIDIPLVHIADAVVLGCTEIELLVRDADAAIPLLETARIHAETAADDALDRADLPAPPAPGTRRPRGAR